MQVRIEKRVLRSDARGWVFEPLDSGALAGFRNVHAVMSEPGAVRGNHWHERGREVLAVIGPARIRVEEAGERRDHDVPAGEVWQFTFPPGLPHAIQNTGDRPIFMVGFNTEPHDPTAPDTQPCELIAPA